MLNKMLQGFYESRNMFSFYGQAAFIVSAVEDNYRPLAVG